MPMMLKILMVMDCLISMILTTMVTVLLTLEDPDPNFDGNPNDALDTDLMVFQTL